MGLFMKKIVHIFVCAALVFLCAMPSEAAKKTEKPDIKEYDGSFFIPNRDSMGKPFVSGKIFVFNKTHSAFLDFLSGESGNNYQGIFLIAIGELPGGKSEPIFYIRSYPYNYTVRTEYFDKRSNREYYPIKEPAYNLSAYEKIFLVSANGAITKANVKIKKGNLYLTIKKYDFSRKSKAWEEANAKEKEEKLAAEKLKQEKLEKLKSEMFSKGKRLYRQKILDKQSINNPIIVNYSGVELNSAKGAEVYITFYNNSGKTLKYVEFDLMPYNRVNDITHDVISGKSLKTVKVVDYIESTKSYKAHFEPVWYNPTISYIKIKSIKATFKDGSVKTVRNVSYKMPDTSLKLQKYNANAEISFNYDISENDFYIKSVEKGSMLSSPIVQFYFENEIEPVSIRSIGRGSYNSDHTFNRIYSLDDNDIAIAAATAGYVSEYSGRPMIPNANWEDNPIGKNKVQMSEAELQHIRDYMCIMYYVKNKDKK